MEDQLTAGTDQPALQFRLSTIFVLTLIASLLAAFLRPSGSDMLLAALITTIACGFAGFVVGQFAPPQVDRVFWAAVVSMMMLAVCKNVILLDRLGIYAWPLTAGFAAIIAAGKGGMYRRMSFAGVGAAATIVGYLVSMTNDPTIIIGYVFCASVGGALIATMIDGIRWAEKRYRIPQPAIALAMVLGGMTFSTFAPNIIPGW